MFSFFVQSPARQVGREGMLQLQREYMAYINIIHVVGFVEAIIFIYLLSNYKKLDRTNSKEESNDNYEINNEETDSVMTKVLVTCLVVVLIVFVLFFLFRAFFIMY